MLDRFIERWSGPTLLAAGAIGILLSLGGAFDLLPPPLSVPAADFRRTLTPHPVTFVAQMLGYGGMFLVTIGATITRHFRRERQAARTA